MAAPANDNLANATVLAAGTNQISGDNSEATVESGEVRGQGGTTLYFGADFTVWFRWTATTTAAATFTPDTSWNSIITIWRAKSGVSDPVTAFADLEIVESASSSSSPVTFTPTVGRTYYIQLSGVNFASSGPYVLSYPSPGFSLFTSQTPSGTNNSDGTPGITTATSLIFAVSGVVNAIRFRATTTVSGTYTGALWQVTGNDDPGPGAGTLLASKVRPTAPTGGAWNLITFDPPVAVTAGTLYRAGLHSSAGRYVNTANGLASGVTNGDISAPASGGDPAGIGTIRNGTFAINASLTYPATVSSASNYFVDVDFTPGGGGPTTHTGAAALSVTATLAAGATSAKPAAAARTVTATLTAGATGARPASAARAVTATLIAGAAVAKPASAGLSATATLAAGAVTAKPATAGLAVTATLAASTGSASSTAAAALPVTATLTAAAAPTRMAATALAATATLTAAGTVAKPTAAALPVTATLAAAADVGTPPVLATAALAVTATLTAGGSRTALASAALGVTATLAAGVARAQAAQVALAVTAALAAGAPLSTQVAAALAVLATLTASLNSQGQITYRPFTGTTSRPYAGITLRP